MVQRTEVVKAAEARARQVIEDAEAQSRRMRLETEDYCDQKLASFENVPVPGHQIASAGRKNRQAPRHGRSATRQRYGPPRRGPGGAVVCMDCCCVWS